MSNERPNLFEIIGQYQADLNRLSDLELPVEVVMDTMESMQGDVTDKIRAIVAFALQLESDAAAKNAHAKRMTEAAEVLERRAESLRMYAQIGLMNSGLALPLRAPEFNLNLAKMPPSVEVIDADALPTSMLNKTAKFDLNDAGIDVSVTPNESGDDRLDIAITGIPKEHAVFSMLPAKKPILDALKAGRAVPGAKLAPLGFRLTVR